ncbi:MAG: collagenase, partial [Rickettsiales bacterium]|nr:collagenase [Rickettsiales bacterium]
MIINRQVNKNITKEEYFNNGGKGFNSPHIIEIEELNIKVEVYSHNLRASKVPKIESEIRETATNFKNAFKLEPSSSEQTFKIYVFDDKDDYTHLGRSNSESNAFGLGLGDEGGMCRPGSDNVCAEMYVYQKGGVLNFPHEFAHGLTYLAGGKQVFENSPKALTEGIADYFEHYSDHKFNAQGSSIDKTGAEAKSLSEILVLKYSDDNKNDDSLVYKTGHALVMYLQEKDPSLLQDYLEALRKGESHKSEGFLSQIKGQDDAFKGWLAENNTDTAMKKINALQVTKGDFIAAGQEIVDKEIKNVSYYRADIKTMDGEEVGSFSPVEYVAFYDVARAVNRATNDSLDISKEYHFLKVL